jgi:D-sedoheptulose 7-phosphate isomerase
VANRKLSKASPVDYAIPSNLKSYFSSIQLGMNSVEASHVNEFIGLLKNLSAKKSIFLIGNGGSASIASHFAVDLERSFRLIGKNSKIISLTDSASSISAISNDFSFVESYSSIIQRQGSKGDLLVVISSSGNSTNLVRTVSVAKEIGVQSIGLLGFEGGLLLDLVDVPILVKTEPGAYPVAEDIHSSICHFVSWSLRGGIHFKK